jgi:hypothetical protein
MEGRRALPIALLLLSSWSAASSAQSSSRARVTLVPPDSMPRALFDSLGTITGSPLSAGPYRRDIVIVEFKLGTPLAVRQAAIDSVSGKVVGGVLDDDKQDGAYYVRIQGGTTAALLTAVQILQRQPQVAIAIWLNIGPGNFHQDRRTVDSDRWKNAPDATRDLRSRGRVPAQAPDSISSALWDSLTAPANLMTDAPVLKGTWARNVMFITFKRTATQAERQAAIALINGEVVGGRERPMGERQYIVRIPYALPGDSISGPLLRAFIALKDHPSVVVAYPLGMANHNVLYDRRPNRRTEHLDCSVLGTVARARRQEAGGSSIPWITFSIIGPSASRPARIKHAPSDQHYHLHDRRQHSGGPGLCDKRPAGRRPVEADRSACGRACLLGRSPCRPRHGALRPGASEL